MVLKLMALFNLSANLCFIRLTLVVKIVHSGKEKSFSTRKVEMNGCSGPCFKLIERLSSMHSMAVLLKLGVFKELFAADCFTIKQKFKLISSILVRTN